MNLDDLLQQATQAAQQQARPEALGEYAISEALASELRGVLRFADHSRRWMHYNEGIWQPITDSAAAEIAVQAAEIYYIREIAATADKDQKKRLTKLLESCYRSSVIDGALFFLAGKDGFKTRPAEWDNHPYLLPCANGVIDLTNFAFLPHSPDYLFTKKAAAAYQPQAKAARWEAHLLRILPDADIRRHVQRTLGAALVGRSLDEHLEIWHGQQGGNGKSTTAEVVMKTIGDFCGLAAPDLLIQTRHEPHPTRIADLAGKRIVFSHEVDEGKRLAESLVKSLTGDGRQKARYMRGDYFEFQQTFDLFMLVNHKPIITGRDGGIWRRIRLVPFTETIPENERRPRDEVIAELTAEASGILNWLLDGLRDWRADNWWIAPQVRAATENYKAQSDRLGAFIADCCELAAHYTVDKGLLYAEYCAWCDNNGEDAVGKKTFGDLLRGRGIGETRAAKGKRQWLGIRLIP